MCYTKKKKKLGKAANYLFHKLNSVGSFFLIKLRCVLNGI